MSAGEPPQAATRPRRAVRVTLIVALCLAVATPLAAAAVAVSGAHAEVLAQYPGRGAQGVPATVRISAQLQGGWTNSLEDLEIVVTRADGTAVAGRSALNDDVLSFAPDDPLPAGSYAATVRCRDSESSAAAVLDSWSFTVQSDPELSDGAGGSVLVVARDATRDAYLAEILRAEGFSGFEAVSPEEVSADLLEHHAVVILGAGSSKGPHLAEIERWVQAGGELIAMKPESSLAALSGLRPTGKVLHDGYLAIDTARAPGAGLTAKPMQFHGDALVYDVGPPTRIIARLSPERAGPGPHPAVTMREVGSAGGHIAAFSYDVATSVMYTRQGDPAAAGEENDGEPPIRPNDMFMAPVGDHAELDTANLGIPQADEQMRLLSNVLEDLHADTSPLPRLWYLPNGEKAALVMAGDDHATEDGTRRLFERMLELSEPGCDVKRWECLRATSWLAPSTPFTADEGDRFTALGFDVGSHVSTGCEDWTQESLDAAFATTLLEFRGEYPALPAQTGHRLHCIAYSDWLGLPTEEERWGIGLDMNFYNWPPDWIRGRPGYMTGSALPMRFSDQEGRMLNVFQQESHLVNQTWEGSTKAIEQLITAARDGRGYYGAFGTHYDYSDDFESRLLDIAMRRDVPMVSARQLLDFTEGRRASALTDVQHSTEGVMTFDGEVDPRVAGLLTGMLPVAYGDRTLASLTADEVPVEFGIERIKGIEYAFFTVDDAAYEAVYR